MAHTYEYLFIQTILLRFCNFVTLYLLINNSVLAVTSASSSVLLNSSNKSATLRTSNFTINRHDVKPIETFFVVGFVLLALTTITIMLTSVIEECWKMKVTIDISIWMYVLILLIIRGGSRAAAASKMKCFVIIVNGFQPLTIIKKRSILGVAAALDLPLIIF